MSETDEHVRKNRAHWESQSAAYQSANATQLNRWDRLAWGVWDTPEDDITALGDVRDLDALEYGCGASQFGIKVAMRGARVQGLDFSFAQLRQGLEHMRRPACTSRWSRRTASGSRSVTGASTSSSATTG